MKTPVDITYITRESLKEDGNPDLLMILSQSPDTYTIWVCDKALFQKILWAGVPEGDLATLQTRIAEMNLGKFFMGVTDRRDVWFYAGTLIPEFNALIADQKWMMISDAFTGTLRDSQRSLTLYHANPTPTPDQLEIANFIMENLTAGLIPDGTTHWFITKTDIKGRMVFSFCEGDTVAANLPDGWTTVDIMQMVEGGTSPNSITAKRGRTTYLGFADEQSTRTARLKWVMHEEDTAPIVRLDDPTLGI